ncbi:hypothetical protein [Microbulbifer variabilis]|uniref:Uncharacterized protein n=1 Tax=Microbulbifer variabilis TaxID=266805 RepID=A0ABY4VAB6_9GAMM|nr:hypothetical protein [Microbulbifer variabilis]USD21228.1 hypothetical protein MJO52_19535 [Microbulbifer variabilis]
MMKNKIIYYSAISAFIVMGLVFLYGDYRLANSCRVLENISSDDELNEMVRLELSRYFNQPRVRHGLKKTAGVVFNVEELDIPFKTALNDLGIIERNVQLVIKTDRKDKLFTEPYNILEVGVGYSRAYLMFKNENINGDIGGSEKPLKLHPDSYVECKI